MSPLRIVAVVSSPKSRRGSGLRSGLRTGSAGLFAVLFLVLLRAAAYATPPDPLWIPGIYDGGDFDDLLRPVGLLIGVPDDVHIPTVAPFEATRERLLVSKPSGIPVAFVPPARPRAPPAS
jgi:hypothetical protein